MAEVEQASLQMIDISVYDRKPQTRSIILLVTFIVMGLILIVGGFWQTETILWNRIKYGTGSLWKNSNPIYHRDQPNGELSKVLRLLHLNYNMYFVTQLILVIVFLAIIYNVLIKKVWDEKIRIVGILGMIYSGISSFTGFWIFQSIHVIESIPNNIDLVQSGQDWIRGDIGNYADFMIYSSVIFTIMYIIIFLVLGYGLIENSEKKVQIWRIIRIILLILIGALLLYNIDQLVKSIQASNNSIIIRNVVEIGVLLGIFIWITIISIRSKSSDGQSILSKTLDLIKTTPFYAVLIAYMIFSLFPVYLVIKVSLSSYQEILLGAVPNSPLYNLIMNYSSVMFAVSSDEPSFSGALLRSFGLGLGTGLIGITISVTSAYALARFKFKGNSFLTYLILTTQMFPGIILLLPQYVIWSSLGFVDTFGGILLASAVGTTAYCTWMMKGYFETIPIDIEEAAIIDGTGRFGNFTKIAFPLARSGLVAVLIFTFLSSWQDFILARTLLRTPQNYTLPLLSDNYENSQDQAPFFELLAPYSILVALPVVLFFLFMQKDLAKGAVAGSVK
ncbi:MAG: carbohydrate ABC transporter permease [Promethearchaeota archaeon]